MLTARGRRLAVLAVDPSSARSGGSILGDKTRMERLARAPRRLHPPEPEPGGARRRRRGGRARRSGWSRPGAPTWCWSRPSGVGQSETMVAEMTDIFVLLIAPGGGDELQGVKRGIMEMADLILVNKADGAHERGGDAHPRRLCRGAAAAAAAAGRPAGLAAGADCVSALTGAGLAEAWAAVEALAAARQASGALGGAAAGPGGGLVRPRARGRADRAAERRSRRRRRGGGRWRREVAAGRLAPDAAADALLGANFAPTGARPLTAAAAARLSGAFQFSGRAWPSRARRDQMQGRTRCPAAAN